MVPQYHFAILQLCNISQGIIKIQREASAGKKGRAAAATAQ